MNKFICLFTGIELEQLDTNADGGKNIQKHSVYIKYFHSV